METKNVRLNGLITPSIHKKLKKLAKQEKCSANEIVNRAIGQRYETPVNDRNGQ